VPARKSYLKHRPPGAGTKEESGFAWQEMKRQLREKNQENVWQGMTCCVMKQFRILRVRLTLTVAPGIGYGPRARLFEKIDFQRVEPKPKVVIVMPGINIRDGESYEGAVRRFKKQCEKAGIMADLRKHENYEKPSIRKKKKSAQARKKVTQTSSGWGR
jgi:small subunit ribosomal protein S21